MIYAIWHGGSSYSFGEIPEDLETFDSIRDAKNALRERRDKGYGYRQSFRRPDGTVEEILTPAVDESSTMTLYFYDPSEAHDPYPDRMLSFGPRGGVNVERC